MKINNARLFNNKQYNFRISFRNMFICVNSPKACSFYLLSMWFVKECPMLDCGTLIYVHELQANKNECVNKRDHLIDGFHSLNNTFSCASFIHFLGFF